MDSTVNVLSSSARDFTKGRHLSEIDADLFRHLLERTKVLKLYVCCFSGPDCLKLRAYIHSDVTVDYQAECPRGPPRKGFFPVSAAPRMMTVLKFTTHLLSQLLHNFWSVSRGTTMMRITTIIRVQAQLVAVILTTTTQC